MMAGWNRASFGIDIEIVNEIIRWSQELMDT